MRVLRTSLGHTGQAPTVKVRVRVRVRVMGMEGCEGASYFTWSYRSGTYGQGQGQVHGGVEGCEGTSYFTWPYRSGSYGQGQGQGHAGGGE